MPVLGAAGAEPGVLCRGGRFLHGAAAAGQHRNDDRIGTGGQRLLDQAVAIVVGIAAMRVDADEIVGAFAECADGEIDRRALYAPLVVKQDNARILRNDILDDGQRAVGAAAIGDDDPGAKPCGRRAQ